MIDKIKFNHYHDPFFKNLIFRVKEQLHVKNDHRFADFSIFFKFIFWFSISISSYLVALFANISPSSRLLLGIIFSYSLFFCIINICHDALHGSLFRNKKLNMILGNFVFNLMGVNGYLWGLRHVKSHHVFPNIRGCDPDIDDSLIMRLSPSSSRKNFHAFQHYYVILIYCVLTIHSIFIQDILYIGRKKIANLNDINHSNITIMTFWGLKLLYLFIWIYLPWKVTGYEFKDILIGYFIITSVLSFAFMPIALTHLNDKSCHPDPTISHGQGLDTSFAQYQISSSLDWSPTSKFAAFFYGGLNSHAAHHLFPHISHRHYPWITEIIQDECSKIKLNYRSASFLEAIKSHFKYLKLVGKNQKSFENPRLAQYE